ncbi:hypothetical protein R70723_23755 [Paenibacillus sp. FSL R7-0273]|uniref:SDR family oxidoreductase n=1 Tax=Paenibacillus sp. FSL R7-0273 TaxID=1536772 RepID=UPI0004F6F1AB|nr:SDR family oxidoreductase [Paenibacillus sp. FSL R7-0273]AIQ48588.1 hypothetical protein R70723_23755 [Paenibacillus sp. FSL R7-0273]OMF94070.1 hypothetical protein BK144_10805 [Paenibacillus sp. FSL R7-0273]
MGTSKELVLVTGAGGKLGRLAVEYLLDHYEGPIAATTRQPEKLMDLTDRGVIVRQADFDLPDKLDDAFADAKRLLLVSTDTLEVPGQRIKQHNNALKAALKAGVQHIVYTSFFNPEPGTANVTAGDHFSTEEAIKNSGFSYTILRNNLYSENILQSLTHTVATGQYTAAIGEGKIAYVTRNDCAIAAAAALAFPSPENRTMNLTGPKALSGHDIANILGEIAKKRIEYVPQQTPQLVAVYESFNLPKVVAEALASFDTASANGEYAQLSTAFQELTGNVPTSTNQFLQDNFWNNVNICW